MGYVTCGGGGRASKTTTRSCMMTITRCGASSTARWRARRYAARELPAALGASSFDNDDVRNAFHSVDAAFDDPKHDKSGSTATVAVVVNDSLVVANVGDSRAITCCPLVVLTEDHVASDASEAARIQSVGRDHCRKAGRGPVVLPRSRSESGARSSVDRGALYHAPSVIVVPVPDSGHGRTLGRRLQRRGGAVRRQKTGRVRRRGAARGEGPGARGARAPVDGQRVCDCGRSGGAWLATLRVFSVVCLGPYLVGATSRRAAWASCCEGSLRTTLLKNATQDQSSMLQ